MQQLSRDGVTLAYEEAGSGAPPLVFVHGFGSDHTSFAPQVERFRAAHRVVAVDLRGHGASDAPQQDYTIAGFADDVAWLCEQLGLYRPLVVGHSMGGLVALELGARRADLVAGIALLDAPVCAPAPLLEGLAGLAQALRGPHYQAAVRGFIEQAIFLPTDDADVKARVLAVVDRMPQHVMVAEMDELARYDSAAVTAACAVPALLITAAFPLADVARARELCPTLQVGQTVGAGHFHQLLVPQQVNAMLERFLATAAPTPQLATA